MATAWLGKSGVAIVCHQLTAAGRAVLTKAVQRAGWSTEAFSVARIDDIPSDTRAVVACGDEVLKELTGYAGGKKASAYTRGYVLPGYTGAPVVPTFDPSKVALGQMKLLGLVMNDIGKALAVAQGRDGICYDPKAIVDYRVGLGALRELYEEARSSPELLITFDLETATSWGEDEDEVIEFSRDEEDDGEDGSADGVDRGASNESENNKEGGYSRDALDVRRASIRTVQFSLRPGTGVSCDWDDRAASLAAAIMALPNPKAGHNSWLFDEPILRNHGVTIEDGTHDTLWMWHHLQPDLPAHLQGVSSLYGMPFAWKHLAGSDLDFYGAADVDAVQRIMLGLPKALKRLGLWEGYERYVREFRPVLASMERRGIPVSKGKLEELRSWLTVEVIRMDSELQPLVPRNILGRKEWKTWPADCRPFVDQLKQMQAAMIEGELIAQGKKVTKKATTVVIKPAGLGQAWREALSAELGYKWDGDTIYKELEFNPRSSQQILGYLRERKYPIPKRFKDGVDTTSDKELERLEVRTKDPVLRLVRSIRAYSKMGNAYAGKLEPDGSITGGWQPGPDGRLRATITFGPATGQLAARNPNVMTTPKRRPELSQKFRECIVAEPGHKLVEFDYRAFHARTLGLAARCPDYMRLADMDIHSYVTGHLVNHEWINDCLGWPDQQLREYLEVIKKGYKDIRNFKAKPAILGIGFKMGKRRLYFECRESFASEAEAGKLIDLLKKLFPKVFRFQDDVCEEADRTGRLINSWGAIRWFFDVTKWSQRDGRWQKSSGKDAEKASAYLPSSNAHFMLRDKLLQMDRAGWLEKYQIIVPIHDAILFHCPDKWVDECVNNIKGCMEAPVMELSNAEVAPEGFTCAAEAMVGSDWSNMVEVK